MKIVKRFIAKKGLAPNIERSESHLSLSVTLPRHSPTPENTGEPDTASQFIDKTDEPKVLKPRQNVNMLKVHDDSVVYEDRYVCLLAH